MARPLRKILENVTYHVYSRCIEKRELLKNNHFKIIFLDVIKRTQGKYNFELINFVIMDNHFHLKIRTVKGGAEISIIMQYIKSRMAERYNKIMDRTGPFWNERYKSKIIELAEKADEYFYRLIKYFANNPVRKGYVKKAHEYEYSGVNVYFDENYKPPCGVKITLHQLFKNLGKSFEERSAILKKMLNIN